MPKFWFRMIVTSGKMAFIQYTRLHPKMAPNLMKLCGAHMDGSEADYREVAERRLRFAQLRAKRRSQTDS